MVRTRRLGVTSSSPNALPNKRDVVFRSVRSVALAIGLGTGSVLGEVLIHAPAASLGAWNGANSIAAWMPLALLPSEPFSTDGALRAARVKLRLVPTRKRGLTSASRFRRPP